MPVGIKILDLNSFFDSKRDIFWSFWVTLCTYMAGWQKTGKIWRKIVKILFLLTRLTSCWQTDAPVSKGRLLEHHGVPSATNGAKEPQKIEKKTKSAQSRAWTSDLQIFSLTLSQLGYLGVVFVLFGGTPPLKKALLWFKKTPLRGIDPRSPGWKPGVLTVILQRTWLQLAKKYTWPQNDQECLLQAVFMGNPEKRTNMAKIWPTLAFSASRLNTTT